MSPAPAGAPRVRLAVERIRRLAEAALAANGFDRDNARAIAGCVADAERDGAASHGLARIPVYIRATASGRIAGDARPHLRERSATHLVVDAGGGYAAPAVALARPVIAAMAAKQGMVLASFRESYHLHALWWDVEPLAEGGLLALAMVATRPVMAAFGGRGRALGTNPIALSAPRDGAPPLTLDMAASAAARGEIGIAARDGAAIPEGWALDVEGHPTRDAKRALAGTQLPFSDSPKAAALALTVELLAAALSGGRFGFEAARDTIADDGPMRTGSMILAFDSGILGASGFAGRVADLTRHLAEAGATRLPGDRRHERREENTRHGVMVEARLLAELGALAGNKALAQVDSALT